MRGSSLIRATFTGSLDVVDLSHGERKRASILATGIALWRDDPAKVSARRIGAQLGMTHSAVLYHFGNVEALRSAIAVEAVRVRDDVIIPQLIASRHPAAAALSATERRRYLAGC